jgi:DNA-binding LacI/PurR family transcriptional regulator
VVAFSSTELATYCVPPLTTVIMKSCTIAEQALDLLFRMIEGKQVISPLSLRPTLAVRGSTAPLVTKHAYSVDS